MDLSAVLAPLSPNRVRPVVNRWWSRLGQVFDDLGDRAGLAPGLIGFAVRFPLTRPIARRRAGAVFDLCAGFVYSQVLTACVRLDLFTHLRRGPRSLPDLARALDLPEDGARRLLDAATALRLAKRAGRDRYRLGALGRAVLLDPGIGAMVEHHGLLYRDLADPVALLRGDRGERALGAFWSYSEREHAEGQGRDEVLGYTRLMSASQAMVSREVVKAFAFGRHRRMVDVAGGDGTFLEAVLAAAQGLEATLFDLPAVAAEAEARFARVGLSSRTRAVGGDFRHDPLPAGADLMSLIRVLHDHDDATAIALLTTVYRALEPGGALLVAEPLAETAGAERVGGAYFGFYLMAMGQGRPRSAAELTEMLSSAGFVDVARCATALPIVTSVLTGRKPENTTEV